MYIKPTEDILAKHFPNGIGLMGEVPEKITTLSGIKVVSFPIKRGISIIPIYLGILTALVIVAILVRLGIL